MRSKTYHASGNCTDGTQSCLCRSVDFRHGCRGRLFDGIGLRACRFRAQAQATGNDARDYETHCITFHPTARPFLVSPELAPYFRHRRGRKTKTSSDASDEAPERARKDAPKEAKLRLDTASSFSVFPAKFLRLSSDASHVRRARATILRLPAREICCRCEAFYFHRRQYYSKKSDLRTKKSRTNFRPQACPGSLSRVSA